jgi:transcriptional regulator with XRE-family HTH domain
MVDRIRELLLARQLSPTQFADAIGVARPIVSHILSGRNKPSLEVVQKVLTAFPDLAMPWLLSGTGPMLATAAVPAAPETAPQTPPALPRVPAPRRAVAPGPVVAAPAVPEPEALAPAPPTPKAVPATATVPAVHLPSATHLAGPAGVAAPAPVGAPAAPVAAASAGNVPPELALFAEPGKAIRRIVIFYRDGTFADYQPE